MLRNETRQIMYQEAFTLDPAVKRFETYFAPAIMARKRQEFSQTTSCYVPQDQSYSRQVMKGVLKMINVETCISINRPLEEVFVYVSDHQHHQTRRKSCHP